MYSYMKLEYIGWANINPISRSFLVYVDRNTNKYYFSPFLPPKKYAIVRDRSLDYTLIGNKTRQILAKRREYNSEVQKLIRSLEPIKKFDAKTRKVNDEFDFYERKCSSMKSKLQRENAGYWMIEVGERYHFPTTAEFTPKRRQVDSEDLASIDDLMFQCV